VCKVNSESCAENTILITSSCLVNVVALEQLDDDLPTMLVVTASFLDWLTVANDPDPRRID